MDLSKGSDILKLLLIIVVAVIIGSVIFNAVNEQTQAWRRAEYLKHNPNQPVNVPVTATIPAVQHPENPVTVTISGVVYTQDANGNFPWGNSSPVMPVGWVPVTSPVAGTGANTL